MWYDETIKTRLESVKDVRNSDIYLYSVLEQLYSSNVNLFTVVRWTFCLLGNLGGEFFETR